MRYAICNRVNRAITIEQGPTTIDHHPKHDTEVHACTQGHEHRVSRLEDHSDGAAGLHCAHDAPRLLPPAIGGAILCAVTVWQAAESASFWRTLVTPQNSSNDWVRVLLAISILASFWDGFSEAVRSLRHLRPDMNALVLVSIVAASGLGEWQEGATVAFLFSISHHLEAFSLHWTSGAIRGAEPVYYGGERGGNEQWIERFARLYTPAALILSTLVAVVPSLMGASGGWRHWLQQGMVVLLISCPCALVISAPVAFSAAIASAARAGFTIRNGSELEAIAIDPAVLPAVRDHARRAINIVKQNVGFAVAVKLLFLTLALKGEASLWIAVLADTGAVLAVTMNGLRLLRAGVKIPASLL